MALSSILTKHTLYMHMSLENEKQTQPARLPNHGTRKTEKMQNLPIEHKTYQQFHQIFESIRLFFPAKHRKTV